MRSSNPGGKRAPDTSAFQFFRRISGLPQRKASKAYKSLSKEEKKAVLDKHLVSKIRYIASLARRGTTKSMFDDKEIIDAIVKYWPKSSLHDPYFYYQVERLAGIRGLNSKKLDTYRESIRSDWEKLADTSKYKRIQESVLRGIEERREAMEEKRRMAAERIVQQIDSLVGCFVVFDKDQGADPHIQDPKAILGEIESGKGKIEFGFV